MSIGLLGKKIGMTREFVDTGISIPVTVLFVENIYYSMYLRWIILIDLIWISINNSDCFNLKNN